MSVLSIAELSDGGFRKVTFEALSEGKRIAEQLGTSVNALVIGSGISEELAAELGVYGAETIWTADDPKLAEFQNDVYTQVAADLIADENPDIIILGATTTGKELAARLAARLKAPLAMDCVSTQVVDGRLTATRPMYGGKIVAEVAFEGTPQVITVRPNAMTVSEGDGAGRVATLKAPDTDSAWTLIDAKMETGKVELTEADIVVTGGRGMGGEDYRIVEELAAVLEGAVGASRSAVDEGWRPVSDQVGQTGKTVSPSLYIAFGVSGAIQHLAGMQTSKVIVAVNKDPDAPIFLKADYGIVGDLFEVVPAITAAVQRLKSQ